MTEFHTAGEVLCDRELRKESRQGVAHYVTGQHHAAVMDYPAPGVEAYEMAAELTYVDVMGHAVLVVCVLAGGGWSPITVVRAGQIHTFRPCLASKAGFELSAAMIDALREIE